jgi:uncharacterized membrane protein
MNLKNSELMSRIGLGIFFLVFGLLKLTKGTWFIEGPYKMFYGIGFSSILIAILGIIQIAMAISFFTDKYARQSAYVAAGMMLITIVATLPKIASTFTLPPPAAPPS